MRLVGESKYPLKSVNEYLKESIVRAIMILTLLRKFSVFLHPYLPSINFNDKYFTSKPSQLYVKLTKLNLVHKFVIMSKNKKIGRYSN